VSGGEAPACTGLAATPPMSAVAPGEWLGLLGGGQLGRMFTMAAQRLGYRVCVLDPDEASPAAAVADDHLCADYLDAAALEALARRCRAVTTEFENVAAAALARLAEHCTVRPAAASVEVAQNRVHEKRFLTNLGIAVAPHAVIASAHDLERADASLFPGILKTARLGYDGKGQAPVADAGEAAQAWERLGRAHCVLERQLPLAREISVIVCRSHDGRSSAYPVSENEHRGGILAVTLVPARIAPARAVEAQAIARRIAEALDYVGVLCVEFFVLTDGSLAVNELAPRPHNSGHWTLDASRTSQFEQQARILAGLPLGATDLYAPAVMLNLLGELWLRAGEVREPPWVELLADPNAKLHLYGKRIARPGRKMGHLTLVATTLAEAVAAANRAAALLGIAPVR